MKHLTLFLLLILSPILEAVEYEYGEEAVLKHFDAKTDRIYLTITDQVTGGCLPSPNSVKDAVEVELRRLGFLITPEISADSWDVRIYALGIAANAQSGNEIGCAVSLETALYSPIRSVTIPSGRDLYFVRMSIPVWTTTSLLVNGSKLGMQSQVTEPASEQIKDAYLAIMRSKD